MLASLNMCLILIPCVFGFDCPVRDRKNAEETLIKELFADEKLALLPSSESKPIDMFVLLTIDNIGMNSYDSYEFLTVSASYGMFWISPCLNWNSSQHNGINKLLGIENYIWTPHFYMQPDLSIQDSYIKLTERCLFRSKGDAVCQHRYLYIVPCRVGSNWFWPFDKKNCDMVLFGDLYDKRNINFTFHIVNSVLNYKGGWTLQSLKLHKSNESESESIALESKKNEVFKINITMQRHADVIYAYIVYPAIVTIVLTIFSLALHICDPNKIFILILCMGLHFYIITIAASEMPKNSAETPIIYTILRDSLVLCGIILMTSLLSYSSYQRVDTPSKLIVAFNNLVRSRADKMVFYRIPSKYKQMTPEEGPVESPDNLENNNEVWVQFACLVNSLLIVVVSFSYFVYLCIFLYFLVIIHYN